MFDQKLQFTYSLASIKNVQVTEEAFSSQKRPSNTLKHELLNFFLLLWFIFGLLDPDPDSESGSGSTDPIESGFNPDLQPWFLDPGSGMGKNQYPGSGINIRIRNTAYEVHHLSSFNSVTL